MQTDTKSKETPASAGLNWRNKPRRMFTPEQRLTMVRQCQAPGVSVAEVAQRNRINTNLLFKWKRLHERGELAVPASAAALVPVTLVRPAKRQARSVAHARAKATQDAGAIEVEIAGARIFLHGTVSETNLAVVLRALARR